MNECLMTPPARKTDRLLGVTKHYNAFVYFNIKHMQNPQKLINRVYNV